jgi:NitT/TauT family transport system substrate-binding protein
MKRMFLVLCLVLCLASGMVRAETKPLTVGVLPVIQALPLFVAAEEGLFQAEGVDVQLVPFRMAMEKDVAMTTGGIDVNFGDLFTAIFLKNGGTDIRILARNTSSLEGARMFGIVAAPQSKLAKVTDLAGVPVAVSTNTIIEYVTRRIETRAGVGAEHSGPAPDAPGRPGSGGHHARTAGHPGPDQGRPSSGR